ncbi:MAG: amino acid permease [Nanoarchaeota archaeon]
MIKRIHPEYFHRKAKIREPHTLRRDLSLFQATVAGVGIIVGAGIYALVGAGAAEAGNAVWLSFLIGALVAAFTGLSYAELSSMFPKDAGEYLYTEHAFGRRIGFVIGYLVIIAGIIAAAAVALGFAGYFSSLLNVNNLVFISIVLILILSYVNFSGIKQSAFLNVIFSFVEVAGLLMIIALGLKYFGRIDYFEMPHGFTGVLSGAALIFFAYIGFDSIVKLSEETKSASKIIPRALILTIIITTLLYVTASAAAVSVLGWEALGSSKAPLADVAALAFGPVAFIILSIIALFSTTNTVLMELVVTSRMIYGMGKEGFVKKLAKLHPKTRTPYIAIIVTMLLSLIFAFLGKIKIVAGITDFAIFIIFIAINGSLIYLRYKEPKRKRGFRVPLSIGRFPVLPLIGIITTSVLIIHLEKIVILAGIFLILLGLLLFEFFRDKRSKKKR